MNLRIEQAREILSRTPDTLKSLLENLSEDWITTGDSSESWNPYDVVGHLIHGEETDWIPRARIILAQGENPVFEPFDRFAQFEKSKNKTLPELLETFAARRRQSLETLTSWNLNEDQLKLKGTHPELGEVDLEQLLSTWVVHDLTHIRQIVVFLASRYAENVGAWRQYLSILN